MRSAYRILSAALLHAAIVTPACAASFAELFGSPTCYARVYDAAHLAAHPAQQITRLALSSRTKNQDGTPATAEKFDLYVSAVRRGWKEVYEGLAICQKDGAGFECYREGDMGRFRVTTTEGGRLKLESSRTAFEGEKDVFIIEGGSFTIEDEKTSKTGKADDSIFVLDRAPAGKCSALDAWR